MSLNDYLENLTLIELNIMLEHLRLGFDHLKKLLNHKQFKELLRWNTLTETQKQRIVSDRTEIWGNAALILNTIITSTFGAWMGLSGCMGFSLSSPITLTIITGIAFLLSGIIGYNSFKLTKQKAIQAIHNQKLYNLQLKILKVITKKQDAKIQSLTHYLNTKLCQLENKEESQVTASFGTKMALFSWFDQLSELIHHKIKTISHPEIHKIYLTELLKIAAQIKKIIYKDVELIEKLALEPEHASTLIRDQDISFIKILTNPVLTYSKSPFYSVSWLQGHVTDLMLGLAPTLLGGFASMFVFLGGIPNLAKELGLFKLEAFFTHPYARLVELTIAVGLTIYYGFSHLYTNRKTIQRQRVLGITQNKITNQETLVIEKNIHLNMLLKLKTKIYKVILICNFIDKTSQYLNSFPSKNLK